MDLKKNGSSCAWFGSRNCGKKYWSIHHFHTNPNHSKLLIDGWVIHGWFIRENPIKMDDLGVPNVYGNLHIPSNPQKSSASIIKPISVHCIHCNV